VVEVDVVSVVQFGVKVVKILVSISDEGETISHLLLIFASTVNIQSVNRNSELTDVRSRLNLIKILGAYLGA